MKKIFLLAAGLFSYSVLSAQPALSDTMLNERDLPEVVISVNRSEQNRLDIPNQVSSVTSKRISFLNLPTTADLLQSTGQVTVQKSQQGGGSPVIRGFEASRVLLVIDDVRMNNLIYRSGHLQNVVTVDPSILDRMEVVYGPSSTVYGSDALGGVIHLRTKDPSFSETDKPVISGTGMLRFSTAANERTANATVTSSGKRWTSFSSFSYTALDDLKMGKQPGTIDSAWGLRYSYVERFNGVDSLVRNDDPLIQKFSGYSQVDLLQKVKYRTKGNAVHGLNLQYSTSSDIPRYDRLTDPGPSGLANAEWYYGPQKRILAAYTFLKEPSGAWFDRYRSVLSYQYVVESRHNRSFGSANRTNRTEYVNVAGYTLTAERNRNRHDLRLGIDGQYNTVHSTANRINLDNDAYSSQSTRYPDGSNRMMSNAAYVSHSWNSGGKWSVHDGLRLTSTVLRSTFEDTTFYDVPVSEVNQQSLALCGNIGVVWRPDLRWKLSLLGSTGFRAPNVDDMSKIFDSSPGQVIVPNPDLRPERTWSGEFNLTVFLFKHVRFETTAYYTLFTDAIVVGDYLFNGEDSILFDGVMSKVVSPQNRREAYLYGSSSSVEAELGSRWHFVATVNYTHGRIRTDSTEMPLDHIPPLAGRVTVRYAYDWWQAELYSLFNGKKSLDDYLLNGEDNEQYSTSIGMPAWYTFNLRGSWNANRHLTLQAGIENILDQNYRTFASGIHAPGRNFMVAARVQF